MGFLIWKAHGASVKQLLHKNPDMYRITLSIDLPQDQIKKMFSVSLIRFLKIPGILLKKSVVNSVMYLSSVFSRGSQQITKIDL
jgi:hypothetical protein